MCLKYFGRGALDKLDHLGSVRLGVPRDCDRHASLGARAPELPRHGSGFFLYVE